MSNSISQHIIIICNKVLGLVSYKLDNNFEDSFVNHLSVTLISSLKIISIYHTSEQYFSRMLIGQLVGDQLSTIHLPAAEGKQNGFCRYVFTNRVTLWAANYSACVVYTKTIIHLSVGESGRYLSRCFAARQISTTTHLHFGE